MKDPPNFGFPYCQIQNSLFRSGLHEHVFEAGNIIMRSEVPFQFHLQLANLRSNEYVSDFLRNRSLIKCL